MTRTSFDMELDLQASQTKLSHLNDENTRLRELKKRLEDAKARGLYKHIQRINLLISMPMPLKIGLHISTY